MLNAYSTSTGRLCEEFPAYSSVFLRLASPNLRTVIVTAAVYRGFSLQLRQGYPQLTAPFNLPAPGRCQSVYRASAALHRPVFLVNSRLSRFSATALSSGGEPLHLERHPFSRSYGVILPSSLTVNHSSILGYSPRLPVSDYGTVTSCRAPRGFSWQRASPALDGAQRPLRRRCSTKPGL